MKFFRENLSLKIASLALAIGVWAYVRGEDRPVQIFSVPLEMRNIPDDLVLAGGVAEAVSVRVRGPESVLRSLGNESLVATVDLEGLPPGEQTVRVGRESVRVPQTVEVVRVTPEFVGLRLERKVRTDLPVTARIVGNPAPGYVLGSTRVIPMRTLVEGPESALAEAVEVDTETIRIDGRSKPFEVMVDLYPARPDVKIVGSAKAQVLVTIHEQFVTRAIEGVQVITEGADFDVVLEPKTVEVTVEGAPEDVAAVTAEGLAAVLDLSTVPKDRRRTLLQPRIVFTEPAYEGKVNVRGVAPEAVSVRINRGAAR